MKLLIGVFALVALATADDIDWSTVRPRDITIDLPYVKPFLPEGRIVGGNEVVPNSIPYQVALLITTGQGTFFCGASLISQKFVLTAAHCVDGASTVEVRLAAHRVQENEANQIRLFTAKYVVHEGWDATLIRNDIAVVELPSEVQLSEHIQVVALPRYSDASNTFSGNNARISGWGLDSDSASAISQVLRQVFADVITNLACNISYLGIIQNTHVCSSGAGGKGACSGDSGGPLVIGNKQIGIVSFGLGLGCEIGWPSAFTRVTSYLDWIASHTDAHIDQ